MQAKFAFLSKFGIKFIEVAGAGLASALCAFCLGQLGEPRPAPPAPIVQVLPASEDAIRMARDDHALLAALVRKETEHQKREEVTPPALVPAAAKPAKSTSSGQGRRAQKPEPTASVETPPRAAEPLPLQPPTAASPSAPRPAARSAPPLLERDEFAVSASPNGEEEHPLLARLGQIPSWFLPGNDRVFGEVPRPPMPVGEFFPSAM